jgi:hypothetical protein
VHERKTKQRAGRPALTKPGGRLALPFPFLAAPYFTLIREMLGFEAIANGTAAQTVGNVTFFGV